MIVNIVWRELHGNGHFYSNNRHLVQIVFYHVLQEGDFLVRTHHVEYCDGGILDPDDILSDLVEDKDKVRTFWGRMCFFCFFTYFLSDTGT